MKKLIIEVKGGLVQAVYSDAADLSVAVVDWDNIKADPDCTGAEWTDHEALDRMPAGTKALVEREAASLC